MNAADVEKIMPGAIICFTSYQANRTETLFLTDKILCPYYTENKAHIYWSDSSIQAHLLSTGYRRTPIHNVPMLVIKTELRVYNEIDINANRSLEMHVLSPIDKKIVSYLWRYCDQQENQHIKLLHNFIETI